MASKEQERQELHRTIWALANELRGSVDGWDFKSYVLGFLFYRYISEDLASYINEGEHASGNPGYDYALEKDSVALTGKESIVAEKGYFILPSQLFENVRKVAPTDENLNVTLQGIFSSIESSAGGTPSERDFKGLFDDIDVNNRKLGSTVAERNKKLTKIIECIGGLRLGNFKDNTNDAFGDAYEFLMTMYASDAGKSGGEFFTPQEVGELLARIVATGRSQVNKVYDPCCGSGSLLLKFAKILGPENVLTGFYGQEINITSYNLARINMILHNVGFEKFDIALGDTLLSPRHWDEEPFDAIVSNPPYSIKWEGDSNPLLINDPRFAPAGVLAPKGKADLAFTMHMLSWLSTGGTAAIVEFPGVLYRGGAEGKIRKYLVDNNYVDTVIQLPDNLFFGVSIATCIIVLRKSKSEAKTFFIDASAEFVHEGNKNKLSPENIAHIHEAYQGKQDRQYFCRLADNGEIASNDYNLSVSSYVEQEDKREKVDIAELNARIDEIVGRESVLRSEIDKIIAELEA